MTTASNPLATRIAHRTREVLQQAAPLCRKYRRPLPDPLIRFDLRGQAAGQVRWRHGERPLLRYNLAIAQRHEADFLARTVPHEVAHLVTAACHGRTPPHGREWRAVMAYLGVADATRCHDYALDEAAIRRQRRWAYVCDCTSHSLSTTRHNRIQASVMHYHCRHCRAPLRPAESATQQG